MARPKSEVTSGKSAKPDHVVIFRHGKGVPLAESHVLEPLVMNPVVREGLAAMKTAGLGYGNTLTLLFSAPGMSLTHAWFRSEYPLPRHSHNADCVYYIVAGSVRFGTETLSAGDGFFVPAEAAYSYVAGADGVELVEFRTADTFNTSFLVNNPSSWSKAAEQIAARRDAWISEKPPLRVLPAD